MKFGGGKKIVNQNDIPDIIKANIEYLNDITDIVVNTATKLSKLKLNKSQFEIFDIIFGENGILYDIQKYTYNIKKFNQDSKKSIIGYIDLMQYTIDNLIKLLENNSINKLKKNISELTEYLTSVAGVFKAFDDITADTSLFLNLKIRFIKRNVKQILEVFNMYGWLSTDIRKSTANSMKSLESVISSLSILLKNTPSIAGGRIFKWKLNSLKSILSNIYLLLMLIQAEYSRLKYNDIKKKIIATDELIKGLINMINVLNNSAIDLKLWVRLKLLKRYLLSTLNIIIEFNTQAISIDSKKTTKKLNEIKNIINIFSEVMSIIDSVKAGLGLMIKFAMMKRIIPMLNDFLLSIENIKVSNNQTDIKSLAIMKISIELLSSILNAVLDMPGGVLARRRLKGILTSLKTISKIINSINRIRINRKTIRKINLISALFGEISKIMILIILMTPIAVAFSIAIIVFIGAIWILSLSVSIIMRLIRKMVRGRVILGTLVLISFIGMLVLIGLALVGLSIIAIMVVGAMVDILKLLGIILAVTVAVSIMGFMFSFILPFAVPILLGLGFITIVIGALLLISWLLIQIQKIELDFDKIKYNVDSVMSTCISIIDGLFNTNTKNPESSSESWIESIISGALNITGTMIKAIMAVGFLAISVAAIGMITFLAVQLRILQTLDLNPELISNNVNTVITTSLSVIDTLFKNEEEDTNPSNKSWIVSVIEYIGGGITKIINAIMAVGFLAISIVAIGLITILATQLRILQTLDLKPELISKNVELVLNTSKTVLNVLKTDMGDILGAENTKRTSLISWMFPKLADLASILSSIGMLSVALVAVGSLAQIAEHLKTINEITGLEGVEKKASNLLKVASNVVNVLKTGIEDVDIDADDVMEKMVAAEKMADVVTKFVKLDDKYINNSTKATENFVKFIDKVNTTDLSKINATAKLFQNMSKFSESIRGNFEGLADALNEKIAPLLEELKDLLSDIPNTINTSSDKISQTVVNNSPKENITPEKARKNAELFGAPGTKENEKMVKQQMVEKEEKDREKRRIEDILMDIKDILNGAGAYTAGVKTR